MNSVSALIAAERRNLQDALVERGVLVFDKSGVASNADKDNRTSREVAAKIAEELGAKTGGKLPGQGMGAEFECVVEEFVANTFPKLQGIRPGKWEVIRLGNRNSVKVSAYAQYEHLQYLDELTKENKRLSAMIGNDYMVAPDIVVYRGLYSDEELNDPVMIVDNNTCTYADIREANGGRPILHASISAKWTIRSDRAQNSRTEALNLIRNRKGSLPHIVIVTGEPVPSRLSSVALGTGDIDCVYHFALYELIAAVSECDNEAAFETLMTLVEGKRLKDISDLPLDLSV